MSYVGWKILAYRYHHDRPEQQAPVSKKELVDSVRQSFQSPDWSVAEHRDRLILTHVPTQSEVNLEVHGEEVEIEYEDGPDRELYLCGLSSDCLAWKRGEREHKRLMHEVLRKLPWREKLGGYIDDSRFMLAYSSNIEDKFEPYEVALRRLAECPIPEKPQRHRRRRLKLKPRTSYLGTRITVRKKRWDTKYNLC